MLFATTTTTDLMAAVGGVSSPTFTAILPFLYVAIGIPLAFYIGKKLIALLPKGK